MTGIPCRYLIAAGLGLIGLAGSTAVAQQQPDSVPMTRLVWPAQARAQAQPEHPKADHKVYDESADGKTQIARAIAQAKKNNRRVLIQWGGNWCGWCVKLAELMERNPDIRRKILYEYDLIHVDIGHFDKNMELAAKYGADLKANGVPFLTVLDGDGKVIANQETGALELKNKPAHDPQKVLDFLTKHQASYPSASAVLADGLAKAKAEHKTAFVHFGAPWCGWCHKLETFLARDDIRKIMDEHFVDIKIDTDRTIGGQEMLTEYRKSKRGGIPWFVLLDGDGNEIVNSSSSGQNIGYPGDAPSAAIFVEMLKKAQPDMTDDQLDFIKSELVASMKKRARH